MSLAPLNLLGSHVCCLATLRTRSSQGKAHQIELSEDLFLLAGQGLIFFTETHYLSKSDRLADQLSLLSSQTHSAPAAGIHLGQKFAALSTGFLVGI